MVADVNSTAKSISRREFLTYLWGASAALLVAEAGGAAVWFALPHNKSGPAVGFFTFAPTKIPLPESAPIPVVDGKFWLSNTDKGLLALSMFCVHRIDAFYKWVDTTHRFECPVCGSIYLLDGRPVRGPAGQYLNRYPIKVFTPNGILKTLPDGSPINVEGATSIVVNTNIKIMGQLSQQY